VSSPAQRGPRVTSSAFCLGDLNSSLPNALRVETPSRSSRSPGVHSSTPRFRQNPDSSRRERGAENTTYGLHLQYIGFLGETFVSTILYSFMLSLENAPLINDRSMGGFRLNYKTAGTLLVTGRAEIVIMSFPIILSMVLRRISPTSHIQTAMEVSPVY
jgi:hypothetical protein